MKKILIGTHNQGKFKEIAYLISRKFKKISPAELKIRSPKETGKTFSSNSKLKVNFFSKFVKFPVISDDSGLCIKALNNKPGVHSARLAQKKGGFTQAMKYILKRLELKKNRLHDKVVGQIQRYMGFIKGEIANDDQKVKGLIIGLKESLGLQRAISINPDIEYRIYKISFELLKK